VWQRQEVQTVPPEGRSEKPFNGAVIALVISSVQVLLLGVWLAFIWLLFLFSLIARFYEFTAGESTYYRLYSLPFLFFTLATVRYILLDKWGGDLMGDLLLFLAGGTLIGLSLHLYRRMTKKGRS
jgi:hypothetical protein